jgi:hypothetical protein
VRQSPAIDRVPRRLAAVVAAALAATLSVPVSASAAVDGTSTVAGACEGSSNPTFYANNRRAVALPSGRVLAVFDPHGSAQTLAWRDPEDSAWSTKSIYSNQADDVANDRPASVALDGAGNAWVVLSGYSFAKISGVKLRRLTNLDAPSGPTAGPIVTVQPAGRGNVFADLAFQDGRGAITWLERTGDTQYQLRVAWFTNLATDTPIFEDRSVLFTSSSSAVVGTLVPTSSGMRVVARAGKLKVFAHLGGTQWSTGTAGVAAPTKAKPSAVSFGTDILATFQSSNNTDIVKVVRFSNSGNSVSTVLTTATGYAQPTIASNGTSAWVVMVQRATTRTVVSRRYDGAAWSSDTIEVPANAPSGGDYAWPNAVREVDGKLRFIVDGQKCATSTQKNAVLYHQRSV